MEPARAQTERESYGRRTITEGADLAAMALVSGYPVQLERAHNAWRYLIPSEWHTRGLLGERIAGQLNRVPVDHAALERARQRLAHVARCMLVVGAHAHLVTPLT